MRRIATAALVLAVVTAACGGTSSSGPAGVDRSGQASAVSEADKGALCDWYAPMVGGYGAAHPCAEALITAPPDHASCVAEFPRCTGSVTIGQFEDCVVAIVAAQNECTQQALIQVMTRADCQAVGAAGCFDSN